MPNKKAAIKSLRQDKKKQTHNKATIAELRTLAKKARVLITENKKDIVVLFNSNTNISNALSKVQGHLEK